LGGDLVDARRRPVVAGRLRLAHRPPSAAHPAAASLAGAAAPSGSRILGRVSQLPAKPRSGLPFRVARRIRDETIGRPPSPLYGLAMPPRATFGPSDAPAYRLNLVVPTLESARVFGGIRTAMDLFEVVAASTPEHRVVAGGGDNPVSANAQA